MSISWFQTSSVSGSVVSSWKIPKQSTSDRRQYHLKPCLCGSSGGATLTSRRICTTMKTFHSTIKFCQAPWDRNGTYYQCDMMVCHRESLLRNEWCQHSKNQTSSVSGSLVSSWNIPKQSTSYLKPVSAGPPGHLEGLKTIKTSDSEIKSCNYSILG